MDREETLPICVDLDESLVRTDVMIEGFFNVLCRNPGRLPGVLAALLKGRAAFKKAVAQHGLINVATLPYHSGILTWLRQEHASGRRLVLATAAHKIVADAVAEHLGIFDMVFASEDKENLGGRTKAKLLVRCFGEKGFIYVGDSRKDLAIWKHAAGAVLVNPGALVRRQAEGLTQILRVFEDKGPQIVAAIKCVRPHQWVKNLLIFAPFILAHRFLDLKLALVSILAFFAFSMCASSVYVFNDLVDLESDRRHPVKQKRPFASGQLSLAFGLVMAPLLLLLGLRLSWFISAPFTGVVAAYYIITLLYSLRLKQVIIADVLVLAALYTMRIFAGSVATKVPISTWLLGFSIFFFFSLALMKRISELVLLREAHKKTTSGRGYLVDDLFQLQSLGAAAGYVAVLVFALYITSPDIIALYHQPRVLWLVCPVLLYWISRVLVLAGRGLVHSDPIVFALRDKTSYVLGLIVILIGMLAQAF
jgi:4-hydroxybenzoate polyprenyltransferase